MAQVCLLPSLFLAGCLALAPAGRGAPAEELREDGDLCLGLSAGSEAGDSCSVSFLQTHSSVHFPASSAAKYEELRASLVSRSLTHVDATLNHTRASSSRGASGSNTSSFLSVSGLLCFEGPPRLAEGALALKKAGVKGELYNMVFCSSLSCAERGYAFSAGEDDCYPGVQTFARESPDVALFQVAEATAKQYYANVWNLTDEQVALMAACTCHPGSAAMAARSASCGSIGLTGSWTHHDPFYGENQLMCDDGPFQYSTYALATLKTTAQMPMHRLDQITPLPCSQVGFGYQNPADDHCFPKLKMNFATSEHGEEDPGCAEAVVVEGVLFNDSFTQDFVPMYGLDESIFAGTPGCQCVCEAASDCQPHSSSPIRDWWNGQDVGYEAP